MLRIFIGFKKYLIIRGIRNNLWKFGTPGGVYISVGEIPTRQLTVRAVVKETEMFRGRA